MLKEYKIEILCVRPSWHNGTVTVKTWRKVGDSYPRDQAIARASLVVRTKHVQKVRIRRAA